MGETQGVQGQGRGATTPAPQEGVYEPGLSIEEAKQAVGPGGVASITNHRLGVGPSGIALHGRRGVLVGGSGELHLLTSQSIYFGKGVTSGQPRFSRPGAAWGDVGLGYLSSPNGRVRQLDLTQMYTSPRRSVAFVSGSSFRLGTDEREAGDPHGYAGLVFIGGMAINVVRPDLEAASGFYARILATAGLGGGLEVRGADVEPYFDWEAMRITAALGGYW